METLGPGRLAIGKLEKASSVRQNENRLALGAAPIYVHAQPLESTPDGRQFVAVIPTTLSGENLNRLIYEISPYKTFGLDYGDIMNDWKLPTKTDEYSRGLTTKHSDWFQEHWDIFLSFRENHYHAIRHESPVSLIPTLMWTNVAGKREWQFPPPQMQLPQELVEQISAEHPLLGHGEEPVFDTLAGLYVVAYMSPRITSKWPTRLTVAPGKSRELGPTQTPQYVVMQARRLVNSAAVRKLEALAA